MSDSVDGANGNGKDLESVSLEIRKTIMAPKWAGIPQGSIDGPFLFNLFINDLFLFICFSTLSNYADDNNLFTTGTDVQLINQMLLSDFRVVNNWFYENFMILNPGKYQ